jgi:hypothetical protein
VTAIQFAEQKLFAPLQVSEQAGKARIDIFNSVIPNLVFEQLYCSLRKNITNLFEINRK